MSGIAGIIHFDGRPVAPGEVEAMTAGMHYRGPDGINHWRKGSVALGQCMLRTTPESLEENQPLTNEDESLVLVMDGRVDNWEELRRELLGSGAVLRTRADAELVLRAYEIWGRACLRHIEGDFALVIWDARRQEAFCARDRVGNKPFNYHWNGRTLVFASDLHAILSLPWVPQKTNEGMLAEYLATEWSSLEETLWQGVSRLVAAHSLVAAKHGLAVERYWEPDLQATLPCKSDSEYIEYYLALFTDVVRRMSRAAHPLACEVSGGLDSSAIFAVAESLRQKGQLPAPALEGYTLDFHDDAAGNELEYCRAVGTHLGRHIREITPASMPLTWYAEQARTFREFPDYPNGAMAMSILAAAQCGGSRVLVSGTGGDEWAGGSHLYYAEALKSGRWRELLNIVCDDTRVAGWRKALWWLLRFGMVPLLPRRLRSVLKSVATYTKHPKTEAIVPWLAPKFKALLNARRQVAVSASASQLNRAGQRRQIENLNHPYITLAREINERRCARMGFEWRQPFWNVEIIQAAFATPEHLRCRGNENKWLHRRAMREHLPVSVATRMSKAEFSVVFTRQWDDLSRHVINDVLPRRSAWANPSQFRKLTKGGVGGNYSEWPEGVLWTIFGVDCLIGTTSPPSQ